MASPTFEKAQIQHCLITGGSGFLGGNLARALLERGCKVRIFDVVEPKFSHENMEFIKGDLCDFDSVDSACVGIDTVFHTASIICLMGGSGVSDAYRDRAYAINVTGTENMVKACQNQGVKGLIYTSSNNVVFNGTANPDMDQSTPYATRIYDLYTETKIKAEELVLQANGKEGLLTCAIRPGGIYGAESNYMLDTMIKELLSGKLVAMIGDGKALHDNTFIENLVHGELLAAEAMVEGHPACGKAYFITDDEPMNNFIFFKPIIEGLGYKFPRIKIPMAMMLPVSIVWQWLHFKIGFPEPVLSPKELDKTAVTHYASIKDSTRDLGYRPLKTVKEAMLQVVPYYQKAHGK
ncbi:MAG: NAD-dependent epimerase/dehydratase family protein [Pseudomonadales bacterium]|nr:NAD-dependent epimerase/dehydratase family protein [Pseudomonadales bacterium]